MATVSNLFIDQGANFEVDIDLTDSTGSGFDLTNHSASAQIRRTYGSSTVAATFATSLDINTSKISLSLTDTETSAINAGRYVYDLVIENLGSGFKTRIIEGQVTVQPGVTR